MDLKNGSEQLEHKGPSSQPDKEKRQEAKSAEVQKTMESVSDVIEGVEVVESGEVSENLNEDKKKGPAGGMASSSTAATVTAAQIKSKQLPRVEVMRNQISKAIHHEIHKLEKEARKITRSPMGFSPFQLNKVVSKIRDLKEILSNLTYATLETLKSWWFKFVNR